MIQPAELPEMQPIKRKDYGLGANCVSDVRAEFYLRFTLNPKMKKVAVLRFNPRERWREVTRNEIRYKEYYLDDC